MISLYFNIINIQIQKMERQKREGFISEMWSYVVQNIQIEAQKRTYLMEIIIYLHYLVDYILLWTIIQLRYVDSPIVDFDWPFIIVRAILAVLFIIFKHPVFFLLNKLTNILQIIVALQTFLFLQALIFLLQLVMCGVWALTKEQRMVHFDSRFQIYGAFLKQIIFYLMLTIQSFIPDEYIQPDNQFILLGSTLVILIIDFSEMYYNSLTKQIFLNLDYAFIVLCIITIYKGLFQIHYFQFLFASFFLFAVVILHLIFNNHQSRLALQNCHSQEIKKLPEDLVVKILIQLKRYAQGKDSKVIETYLYKLKDQSNDPLFIQKIGQAQQRGLQSKKELIDNFVFKILKKSAKSSLRLRDLVIYLFSPSPRLYSFLDMNDWQHRREYKRIIAQQLNDSTLREAEAQKQMHDAKCVIQQYTKISNFLFEELMKQRMKQAKIEQYGEQLIEQLERLQTIAAGSYIKSTQVRSLISRFAVECLPTKYHSIVDYENNKQQGREEMGQLILGAEEDNYFIILQANVYFTKLSYFRREKYLLKHISSVLPSGFTRRAQWYAKNLKRMAQKQFQMQPAFLYNSIGFLVLSTFKIEPTTHRTGRAFKMSIKHSFTHRNILAITTKGHLDSFTQLCRYYGFNLSKKSKRLRSAILDQIKSKQQYVLRKGQNIFESEQFGMQKGAKLCLLSEMKIQSSSILLLQLKQVLEVRLSSSEIINNIGNATDFQFNFNWQKVKFTTEMCFNHIKVNPKLSQQKRIDVNYAGNIVQMRYFEQRIDYKSNFDQERDCPSLITQRESSRFNISLSQFYQKWDRKNKTLPFLFKIGVLIIVLIFLLCMISAIYFLTQFNSLAGNARNNLQVTTKLQEKLQSVILLGEMTTLPFYDDKINVTESINNQIKLTNSLSTEINSLSPNLFNLEGQNILALMNTLNLYINSYLLNPNYPISNILKLLTTSIIPNFQAFIQKIIKDYNSNSAASLRITILIVFGVICLGLFICLWVMQYKQSLRRKEVCEILKCVDNDDLQVMKDRMIRFKEIWLDNIDGKEFEQQNQQENKENMSPPKHFISALQFSKAKIFHIAWALVFAGLSIQINWQITTFWEASYNYISFENNLSSQVTNLQGIWAEFSVEKPNMTILTNFIGSSLINQFNKNVILKSMASKNQIQRHFVDLYQDFWEGDGCCKYFNDSQCDHMMAGALKEGANMAICYLNMEEDGYLANNLTNFSLTRQKSFKEVGLISLYYLPIMTTANNGFILDEYRRMSKQYTLSIQYSFIALVFHSLLILILLKCLIGSKRTTVRIEELLMVMPFEKIKNISLFHKYYMKYYANY